MTSKTTDKPVKKTVKTQKNLLHQQQPVEPVTINTWSSDEPPMPDYFSKDAMKEWMYIVKSLKAKGELQMVDKAQLAIYCTTYANYVEAERKVILFGGQSFEETDSEGNARLISNPWTAVRDKQAGQLRQIAAELGFNPLARAKIKTGAPEKGPKSGAANYFN